jgi:hypothetical protein
MQKISGGAGRAPSPETSTSAAGTTLNEIIERLEKATGPDRELDARVCASVCKVEDFGPFTLAEGCRAEFEPQDDGSVKLFIYGPGDAGPNYVARERSLKFTSSVDAALQLVPEGWIWEVTSASAYSIWRGQRDPKNDDFMSGLAKSPAIALCIAALRARASRDTPSSPEETEASQAKPQQNTVED